MRTDVIIELSTVLILAVADDMLVNIEIVVVTAVVIVIAFILEVAYAVEVLTCVLTDTKLVGARGDVTAVMTALEFAVLPALEASFLPC